jgi:hypothetical protein
MQEDILLNFSLDFFKTHKDILGCIIDYGENKDAINETLITFEKLDIIFGRDETLYFAKCDSIVQIKNDLKVTVNCYKKYSNMEKTGFGEFKIIQINNMLIKDKEKGIVCNVMFDIAKSYIICLEQSFYCSIIITKLMCDIGDARVSDVADTRVSDIVELYQSFFSILDYENQISNLNKKNIESANKIEKLESDMEINSKEIKNDSPTTVFLNDNCSICLNKFYKIVDDIVTLSCSHNFCKKCIVECEKTVCPLCRARFIREDIQVNRILISLLKFDNLYLVEKCKSEINELKKTITENNIKKSHYQIVVDNKKTYLPSVMTKYCKDEHNTTPTELFTKLFDERSNIKQLI